jgi:hypothetical protein
MAIDSGSKGSNAGRPIVYYGALGVVLVVFSALAFAAFGHLFLLNEYRQWSQGSAFFNPLIMFSPNNIFNASAFGVAFSRAFTFEVVAGITSVCGANASCHNAFHIGLLAASGLLLGALLLRLFPGKPVLFIAGAVLFLLSAQPVLDALSWQATLLDKLALFFCALGTYLIARVDLRRADLFYAIEINLALLLIAIAAYNSKEASFPLVPSAAILLAIRFAALAPFSWSAVAVAVRKSLSMVGVPLLYALFHVGVVFINRMYVMPAQGQHITGGLAQFDFFHYVIYLFNLQPLAYAFHLYPYAPESVLVGFALTVIAATAAFALVVVKIAPRAVMATWFWALLSFVLAFAIPLRTAAVSPFYLLVPLYYLAILLCASAVVVWDAARTAAGRAAIQGVVAFALVLHVWGLAWPYPSYAHIAQMSDNFTSALSAVKQRMRTSPPRSILFRWPDSEPLAYMFLGIKEGHGLARYLLPPGTSAEALTSTDASIQDESYVSPPRASAKPGELIVVLGPALKLERIESARL